MDVACLTLGELKSLIRRGDLLICNDAGPRHFAKAFGVPVVTVFGPTHPDWTATRYPWERIVRVELDCSPCQERTCPLGHLNCMKDVGVDVVYAACRELLAARLPGAHSASVSVAHE
jgi:heptosyltransferase-2